MSPATESTVPKGLTDLRVPFPDHQVSKLPKNVAKEGQSQACNICQGWHRRAGLHLDYVGHAAVTDRLLDADPFWQWEPAGVDAHGQPVLVRNGTGVPIGLWIKLTICGVTRWGYGSVEPGKSEPVKELIGDAIRNAAMRFGVALDLWHKGDLHADDDAAPAPEPPAQPPAAWSGEHDRLLASLNEAIERAKSMQIEGDYDGTVTYANASVENARKALDTINAKITEAIPF